MRLTDCLVHSPVGNNGTFVNKLVPAFQQISSLSADLSDEFAVNSTTNPAGDGQFNLTSDVFGIIGTSAYFTYTGSLTTPGCNEGITWFLMQNPMYASPLQILEFTSTLAIEQDTYGRGSNNRLIQPLNNRPIYSSVKLS